MAKRRSPADPNANQVRPPGQAPPTAAEVVAMLASIVAATVRVEGKLDKVLAELAALPRPAGHPAPRRPTVTHAPLKDRMTCRGHRPGRREAAHCPRYRSDH
jgi:hypothetical protein